MDGLAAQFATLRFDPHITLVSGVVDDDVAAAGLAAVAAEWPSLELTAGPTDHGPERFKAVYVTFDDTRIHDLAGTVAAALRLSFDPTTLAPHLSLLYVEDLPAATRADVAARHDVRGEVWRFDSLLASRSAGRPDDVERWQTVATARL